MTTNLTPELQKQIEQEAKDKYPFCWTKNKHGEPIVQRVGQNPHGWSKHQKIVNAYKSGAETYAEKWQEAEQRADRYEKALKQIEQMSDPGDHWKAICDMKAIASESLTPKPATDE